MRIALAFSFLVAAAPAAFASVQWQTTVSWSTPEPTKMSFVGHDEQSNVFYSGFVGVTGNIGDGAPALWRFNQNGALVYRRILPDLGAWHQHFALGTHNDVFGSAGKIARFDRQTGATLWSADTLVDSELYVDENGDVYAYNPYAKRTEKRAYANGQLLWTSPTEFITPAGTNFFANTEANGPVLVSKATGLTVQNVILSPAPTGALIGATLPGGKALLMDKSGRAYGYRPGSSTLNLGLQGTYIVLKDDVRTIGNHVLVSAFNKRISYDSDFHVAWTKAGSSNLYGSEGDQLILYKSVVDVATGLNGPTLNEGYHGEFNNNQIWTLDDATAIPTIHCYDRQTGAKLGEWQSQLKTQGAGHVVTGAFGPSGDLILLTSRQGEVAVVRIASTGTTRWALPIGSGSVTGRASMTVTKDKRVAYVNLFAGSAVTYQIDLTTAKLLNTIPGYVLAKDDFLYKSYLGDYAPKVTSKFSQSTGQELWRTTRVGALSVADDGNVYIGKTKNRALDGQLMWTAAGNADFLVPLGDRVAKVDHDRLTLLNNATGVEVWHRDLTYGYDSDQRADYEFRRHDGRLAVRWRGAPSTSFEFNDATGATTGTGTWGFWDPNSTFHRVAGGWITQFANFGDSSGVQGPGLVENAQSFFSDGNGTTYLVSSDAFGAPGHLFVAKWVAP